ncbi:hypothetical protein CIHG_08333 [Coccidioides immitis H538.4]|uniref:Uncharacterized protein n=1 Tax=Coccidioides immitis H538.4 TaxID=396776 RepID=A0A0J8S244_COCIT|nr:hypothetical protein CIHG_08333 [Coccidioides immitis H538.4]
MKTGLREPLETIVTLRVPRGKAGMSVWKCQTKKSAASHESLLAPKGVPMSGDEDARRLALGISRLASAQGRRRRKSRSETETTPSPKQEMISLVAVKACFSSFVIRVLLPFALHETFFPLRRDSGLSHQTGMLNPK